MGYFLSILMNVLRGASVEIIMYWGVLAQIIVLGFDKTFHQQGCIFIGPLTKFVGPVFESLAYDLGVSWLTQKVAIQHQLLLSFIFPRTLQ